VRVRRLDGIPRRGSVVLLSAGENLVAHRVIALDRLAGHLTTKGDFCTFADAPVQMNDIAGVVVGIVRDGRCRTPFRMRRPWARFMAANSRCHAWLWARFPRAAPRLDVFGLLNRIIERLERWSA